MESNYNTALREDLAVLFDRITLATEMIQTGSKLGDENGLSEVIGFLEACHYERLPDLIKAGTENLLPEDLFAEVLKANEIINITLDSEKNFDSNCNSVMKEDKTFCSEGKEKAENSSLGDLLEFVHDDSKSNDIGLGLEISNNSDSDTRINGKKLLPKLMDTQCVSDIVNDTGENNLQTQDSSKNVVGNNECEDFDSFLASWQSSSVDNK